MSYKWVFSDFARQQCENQEIEPGDIVKALPSIAEGRRRHVLTDFDGTYSVFARNGTIQSVNFTFKGVKK